MGHKNFEKPDNTENVEKTEKNGKPEGKEKENILNKVKDFFAEHGKNKEGKEASQEEKPRNQILETPSEKKSDGSAENKQDGKEEKKDKAAEFRASLRVSSKMDGKKNPPEIKERPKGGVERERGVSDDPRWEDTDDNEVNAEKKKSSDNVED